MADAPGAGRDLAIDTGLSSHRENRKAGEEAVIEGVAEEKRVFVAEPQVAAEGSVVGSGGLERI